jgi:hypothetical protein
MKNLYKLLYIVFAISLAIFSPVSHDSFASKAGCSVFIYISNNSFFTCDLKIDDVGVLPLIPGKSRTYTTELLNDTPKKIKVKVIYDNPDYLEPRSYFLLTKKLECGQSDTLYIAHTK